MLIIFDFQLVAAFAKYESLLAELADTIAEYNDLDRYLRVHVVGVRLRKLQKQLERDTPEFRILLSAVDSARAV